MRRALGHDVDHDSSAGTTRGDGSGIMNRTTKSGRWLGLGLCLMAVVPAVAAEGDAPHLEAGREREQAQAWCEGARPGSKAELGKEEGGDTTLRCLVDGAAEGPGFAWYPDGAMSARGNYVAGRMQGQWRHFYPDGGLKDEGEYRAGAREGEWKFWTAGTLEPEIRRFHDGEAEVAEDPSDDRRAWGFRAGIHSAWSPGQTNLDNNSVTPRLDPSIGLVYESDRYENGIGRLKTTVWGGWMGASNDLRYTTAARVNKVEEYRASFAFATFGQQIEVGSGFWLGAELGAGLSLGSRTDVYVEAASGARTLESSRTNATELGIYPAISALYSLPLRMRASSLQIGASGVPPVFGFSYFTAFAAYTRRF